MNQPIVGLSKQFEFEASHHLPHYEGKCARPHGHSYKLRLMVLAPLSSAAPSGVVVDFDVLKRAVETCVLSKYDHQNLNDFFDRPTAEFMVVQMARDLVAWFESIQNNPNQWAFVYSVRLHETRTCFAEWRNPVAQSFVASNPIHVSNLFGDK